MTTTALQASALLMLAFPAAAQPAPTARPQGGSVVAGQAGISQSAAQTTITQSSQRAAIDWRSFDVGSGHTVAYQQPNASAITLNRVTGPDPSQIAGRIQANGQVVIVNQSGVVFYKGSQVDVQSLVVSSADVTNRNFMAGKMVFDRAGSPDAKISNAGDITVAATGLAALVAPQVANAGTITAKMGHVVLAGAEAHTVDLYGDGLMSVDVTRQVTRAPNGATALVTNTGTIAADGGTIVLTAKAADGIIQNLVSSRGRLQANSVGNQPGAIVVSGVGGSITIEGAIHTDGRAPGTKGGTIVLAATEAVGIGAGARISSNGRAGGGTVAIGTTLARARAQSGGIPTDGARSVNVASGARISADGKGRGSGGTVAVLSTEGTVMAGAITARGGQVGGNGGKVEVSGMKGLSLTGTVETLAPHGKAGTLTIDPTDLTIGGSGSVDSTVTPTNRTDAATINTATFNSLLANNDVNLTATNSILLTGGPLTGDASSPHSLSLATTAAGPGITVNASLTNYGATTFNSSGGIVINAPITSSTLIATAGGGAITVSAGLTANAITLSTAPGKADIVLAGGTISAGTTLNLVSSGAVRQTGGTILAGGPVTGSAVGDFLLDTATLPGSSFATTGYANSIAVVGPIAAGTGGSGTLSIASSTSLAIAAPTGPGSLVSAPTVTLTSSGVLALNGPVQATGTLTLQAVSGISQSVAGPITAGTLTGQAGNGSVSGVDATLSAPGNHVSTLGSFIVGAVTDAARQIVTINGNFTLANASDMVIAGPVAATLIGIGNSRSVVVAGFVSGKSIAISGSSMTLNGDIGASVAADGTGGDTALTSAGAIAVTGGTIAGQKSLALTASSPIAVSGGVLDGPVVTLAGGLNLDGGSVYGTNVTVSGPTAMAGGLLHATSLNLGSLMFSGGDLFSNSDLALSVGNTISGRVTTPGNIVVSGGGGGNLASSASLVAGGTVAVTSSTDLVLTGGTIAAGSNITLSAGGTLQQAAGAAALAGGTLTLRAVGSGTATVAGTLSGSTIRLIEPGVDLSATPVGTRGAASVTVGSLVNVIQCTACVGGTGGSSTVPTRTDPGVFRPASFRIDGRTLALGTLAADTIELHSSDATVANGAITANTISGTAGYGASGSDAAGLPTYGTLTQATARSGGATFSNTGNNILTLGSYEALGGLALTDTPAAQTGSTGVAITATGLSTTTGIIRGGLASDPVGPTAANAAQVSLRLLGPQGNLTINEPVASNVGLLTGRTVSVDASQAVSQSSNTRIVTGSLDVKAGAGITLNSGGNAVSAASLAGGTGAARLVDSTALIVNGASGASVSLSAPGLTLSGDVSAGAVQLTSPGGPITQTAGILTATTLTGSAGTSVSLGQQNQVANLGGFTSGGAFALANARSLTVTGAVMPGGPVSLSVAGNVALDGGSLAASAVNLQVTGALTEPNGFIDTAALTGAAGSVSAPSPKNRVTTLGGFATSAGFDLFDTVPLTVTGALSAAAGTIGLTAPTVSIVPGATLSAPEIVVRADVITLQGGTISTGGVLQAANADLATLPTVGSATAGIFFETGSVFTQTGTTTISALPGYRQANMRVDLLGGTGSVGFATLAAATTNLVLGLGNGSATSAPGSMVTLGNLAVIDTAGGKVALTGIVAGQAGTTAAALSRISPATDQNYQINACSIGGASCSVQPARVVPVIDPVAEQSADADRKQDRTPGLAVGNPLKELSLDFFRDEESTLIVPNITEQGL